MWYRVTRVLQALGKGTYSSGSPEDLSCLQLLVPDIPQSLCLLLSLVWAPGVGNAAHYCGVSWRLQAQQVLAAPQVQDVVKCQMGVCRTDESEDSPDSCKNGQLQILVSVEA